MHEIYVRPFGWFTASAYNVYRTANDEVLGQVIYPDDTSVLDMIDDPLCVWCSDHGFDADEVYVDMEENNEPV